MRRALLLVAALAACTAKDNAGRDTTVATGDVGSALHASDIAGTWTGTTMAEGSDSVTSRWKIVSQNDSTSILMIEGAPDTITTHFTYAGDSLIGTSEPFMTPERPGVQLTFVSVGRLENGILRGTLVERLASNPDSIVVRARWEGKRP